uniref:branched-chain amino acid aminotransferase n=1 Tax=Herbidospora sakaeratensis TaxID=564415 RepID=UPI000AA2AD31|nr:branched-chain amino acid aminotransferase [Herbidospora sakaeratensis]
MTMLTGAPFRIEPAAAPTPAARRRELVADPGFGRVFTDHLVSLRWSPRDGWHDGALTPYRPISLDPATVGLHYGQVVFEGLNAHRGEDGGVAVFRPHAHAARFRRSARRLAMPELPDDLFVAAVDTLVRHDRDWVGEAPGSCLYLRPLMFASEATLALRPALEYRFLLMAFASGGYFASGFGAVTVWVSETFTRAAPGGTGSVKCAGNYGGALLAQAEAAGQGCDQVVWLDPVERRQVEELGGMNLFFVYDDRLVTPPLTSTVLPGVTRECLLDLAPRLGLPVEEAPITVDRWRRDCASGALTEVFACGTAARVTPVGTVRSAGGEWRIGDGTPGPVTTRLARHLSAVQRGAVPGPPGWRYEIG